MKFTTFPIERSKKQTKQPDMCRFRILASIALGVVACTPRDQSATEAIARGRTAVQERGCGVCHFIDGLPGANSRAAPPLSGIARREIIAGRLLNTRENMMKWIMDPSAIEPGVAMPPLINADSQTARDIVAYLYSIK